MQFVLTPSPNVTAERARLRVLRDQIAANVAARKEHDRKFTPRGFAWIDHEELRQLRELASQRIGVNCSASTGEMRAEMEKLGHVLAKPALSTGMMDLAAPIIAREAEAIRLRRAA